MFVKNDTKRYPASKHLSFHPKEVMEITDPLMIAFILRFDINNLMDIGFAEEIYQKLAEDALSSFPDPDVVQSEFANLVLNYSTLQSWPSISLSDKSSSAVTGVTSDRNDFVNLQSVESESAVLGSEGTDTPTSSFDRSSFEIVEAEEAFDLQLDLSALTDRTLMNTSTASKDPIPKKKRSIRSVKSSSVVTGVTNDKNDLVTSQSVESEPGVPGSAGDGYLYDDEFDDFGSFHGYPFSLSGKEVMDVQSGFKLSSRMGKMLGVNPEKCRAHGPGLFAAKVSEKNVFHVTSDGASGFLTVGIQGPSPNNVKKISVEQEKDNLFKVTYMVSTPGYYIIFVRYSDCFIYGSPFVCQVSDTDIMV